MTNEEKVVKFMNFSKTGALSQIFVMTAIDKYAEIISDLTDSDVDRMDWGMINVRQFREAAREWINLKQE